MMDLEKDSTIEIPANKEKLILLMLLSAGLAIYGIVSAHARYSYLSEMGVVGPGLYMALSKSVLLTGVGLFCSLFMVNKLFDRKPGLIINAEGIIDRSSFTPAGFIRWNEIKGFSIISIKHVKCLAIYLIDPGQHIRRVNIFRRILRLMNNAFYGTPIFLSSSTLSISIDKLNKLCEERLALYRSGDLPTVDTPPTGAV